MGPLAGYALVRICAMSRSRPGTGEPTAPVAQCRRWWRMRRCASMTTPREARAAVRQQFGFLLRVPPSTRTCFARRGSREVAHGTWSDAMIDAVVLWGDESRRVAEALAGLFARERPRSGIAGARLRRPGRLHPAHPAAALPGGPGGASADGSDAARAMPRQPLRIGGGDTDTTGKKYAHLCRPCHTCQRGVSRS